MVLTPSFSRTRRQSLASFVSFICILLGSLSYGQEGGLTEEKVKVEQVTADQGISQRLTQVYAAIGGLDEVKIKTVSGVAAYLPSEKYSANPSRSI